MNKWLSVAALVGAVAFSVAVLTSPDDPLPIPSPEQGLGGAVEIVASDLDRPRSITVHGDTVFIAEQKGLVWAARDGT